MGQQSTKEQSKDKVQGNTKSDSQNSLNINQKTHKKVQNQSKQNMQFNYTQEQTRYSQPPDLSQYRTNQQPQFVHPQAKITNQPNQYVPPPPLTQVSSNKFCLPPIINPSNTKPSNYEPAPPIQINNPTIQNTNQQSQQILSMVANLIDLPREQRRLQLQQIYSTISQAGLQIKHQSTRAKCPVCKARMLTLLMVQVDCKHYFCSLNCLKDYALQSTNSTIETIYNRRHMVKCQFCRIRVRDELIFEAFGGQAKINPQLIICQLCSQYLNHNNLIYLDNCTHSFCNECLIQYLEYKITNGEVSEEVCICPMYQCGKSIGGGNVLRYLKYFDRNDLKSKFEEFTVSNLEIEGIVYCPGAGCKWGGIIEDQDLKFIRCPSCRLHFCKDCKSKAHNGQSCEDLKESEQLLYRFDLFMKNNEIKRCPKCGAPCELARGCKFMRCASSICSKKTFFCWLCEQILKENDHYIHYKNDPYGNWCTNMTSTVG